MLLTFLFLPVEINIPVIRTISKENWKVKIIPIKDKEKEEIDRIKGEAKFLSSINHNNIIKYYDSNKDNESFYIVMEFCKGSDLKKLINDYKNQGKSIDQNLIFHIVFSICLGLKEIHEKKIMHRDLKPENIFVTTDNKIKIGDFGISKQLTTNKD